MFSRSDLEPFLKYTGKDSSPILSLYLNVDLSRPTNRNRGILVAARGLLAVLRDETDSHPLAQELGEDATRVEEFLESYEPSGKSLVVFSDASAGLFWHRTLLVSLPSDARFGPQPYVRPLLELLDEHERYGVVLLDRQQARFFSVFFGEIEEHPEAFAALDVKTTRTIGMDHLYSESRFHRRAVEHAHLHIKHAAAMLRDLQRTTGFDRLVIAGPFEATFDLHRLLPRALVDRVVATWKLPVQTSEADLLLAVIRLQEQREQAREAALVEELLSAAPQGRPAVMGLAPTLEAIREARIVHLIYVTDDPIPGGRCKECGTLVARGKGACSFCQGALVPVKDLVARMAWAVAESGGRLEHVCGPSSERLRAAGGIGGLLRF